MLAEQISESGAAAGQAFFPLLSLIDGGRAFQVRMPRLREVVSAEAITPVPYMPAFIRGVMQYGGASIPVIDFQEQRQEPAPEAACVLVFEYGSGHFGVVMQKACEEARRRLEQGPSSHKAAAGKGRVWSCSAWW